MAIDTKDKRRSILEETPSPNGSVDFDDRATVLGEYGGNAFEVPRAIASSYISTRVRPDDVTVAVNLDRPILVRIPDREIDVK